MMLWKNVLVHADARTDARSAVQSSFEIADACDGRIILFDTISRRYIETGQDSSEAPPSNEQGQRAIRARQLTAEFARADSRVPVEAIVESGGAARALLSYATRHAVDLLVSVASSSDVRELTPAGVTAVQLLRSSPVPVWVRAPGSGRAARIVAAVNLSSTGAESLELNESIALAAARLSLIQQAELHVVCVADAGRDRLYQSILRSPQYRRHRAKHRAELHAALNALVHRIGARPVPHLIEGDAVEVLERMLRDLRSETLVLGRDGHNPLAGVLGADVAERLLCRADRSVLLVHSARSSVRAAQALTRPMVRPQDQALS